jgi:hypothetical protein
MNRNFLFVTLSLFAFADVIAQNPFARGMRAKNALFVEVGGPGLGASLNFDALTYQVDYFKMGIRFGVSHMPGSYIGEEDGYAGLFGITQFFGYRTHYIEMGFTGVYATEIYSFLSEGSNEEKFLFVGNIGYRKQVHQGSDWIYRIAFTPVIHPKLYPGLGLSFGRSF